MKIVEITWVDPTEHTNKTAGEPDDDPLVLLKSVGYLIGIFKDKRGVEYVKLCYKKCFNAGNNDDLIVLPTGCISKINIIRGDK